MVKALKRDFFFYYGCVLIAGDCRPSLGSVWSSTVHPAVIENLILKFHCNAVDSGVTICPNILELQGKTCIQQEPVV